MQHRLEATSSHNLDDKITVMLAGFRSIDLDDSVDLILTEDILLQCNIDLILAGFTILMTRPTWIHTEITHF